MSGIKLSKEDRATIVAVVAGHKQGYELPNAPLQALAVALSVVLRPGLLKADGTLDGSVWAVACDVLGVDRARGKYLTEVMRSYGLTVSVGRGPSAQTRVVWPTGLHSLLRSARTAVTRRQRLEEAAAVTADPGAVLVDTVRRVAQSLSSGDPLLLARMADAIRDLAVSQPAPRQRTTKH